MIIVTQNVTFCLQKFDHIQPRESI